MSPTNENSIFKERLQTVIRQKKTHLCLGIDPPYDLLLEKKTPSGLPEFFVNSLSQDPPLVWLKTYCEVLLAAATPHVPAIKPQSAYFEAFGPEGLRILKDLLGTAKHNGLVSILDVKRGDIASTMQAYGFMAYETMGADALTVTAYMGMDVLDPLKRWLSRGYGAYVVWISSNSSGHQIQSHVAGHLLNLLVDFNAGNQLEGALGLVYGATKLDQIKDWDTAILKRFNLLMPGVGAQGGAVTPALMELLRSQESALIPQSRSLGTIQCLPGEPEPQSWEDFGRLVENRVQQAAKTLPSVN